MEQNNTRATVSQRTTFAGGCFWCMEPLFDKLKGVQETTVGYTGGNKDNPTYEEVCGGTTGHAEAIEIIFDPGQVTYQELLDVFWRNIDPTALNKQFNDAGSQYRTAIFYHNEGQKTLAEASRKALERSGRFSEPIVTQIVEAQAFYRAENYHQKYYSKCPLRYKLYHAGSGRKRYVDEKWGK